MLNNYLHVSEEVGIEIIKLRVKMQKLFIKYVKKFKAKCMPSLQNIH